jgi:N-acetylglucosamine kinase-like BadF-type ATPase
VTAALYLGVDGGRSGTRALIADDTGHVIGTGQASELDPAGPTPTDGGAGRRRFTAGLRASVAAARHAAGIADDAVFTAACMGFSGGPDDKDALARSIVPAQAYFITHDAWIALTGATNGAPGIVTIAGTGSIAFGRNAEGHTARAGGWGYAFGDEGSAFDLTRQALRAALRQEEGWGPPTALREALLAAFPKEECGPRDMNDLLHRFYTHPLYTGEFPRARIAALAELVEATALRGDTVAQGLLGAAAQSLAMLAGAVRRKLFDETVGAAVDVRYSGGVFRCKAIQARFKMLLEMEDRTRVSAPVFEAAGGALIEAFRIAGAQCTLKDIPATES